MKRKHAKRVLSFVICVSLLWGLFSQADFSVLAVSDATQSQIDDAEQEKEKLEQELEKKQDTKEDLESEKTKQEKNLEELKDQYQKIASDLTALEEKQTEKEEEISQAEKDLAAAEEVQKGQYEDMKKRIQYMYETPKESMLSLLLQDYSFSDMLNRIDYITKINEYDRKMLDNYAQLTEEVLLRKETLEAAREELSSLVSEAEAKQKEVSALQAKTGTMIDDYLNQIAKTAEDIDDTASVLQAKSEALKKLYAQAEAEEAAARAAAAAAAAAASAGNIQVADSGIIASTLDLSSEDLDMLTAIIYCEARGESYEGQLAVGYVVMNRVRSTKYPGSIEGVIRQSIQFEPVGSGRFDYVLTALHENIPGIISAGEWNSCLSAASACINGTSNVGESLFFRTHAPVPQLAENLEAAGVPYWFIGNHIFYYSWVSY